MAVIQGLHHITLVCADAQRTIDFYTRMLGLRLVKLTVNFDDPGAYHLYFGNETGAPGSAITFFEWSQAPSGKPGIGGTHHFALIVENREALLKWKRYLTDRDISVRGIYDRVYFQSIYLNDPDGTVLEIATRGPGWTVDEDAASLGETEHTPPSELMLEGRDESAIGAETWPEPVTEITPDMALTQGMHHITAIASNIENTHAFYHGTLGLRLLKRTLNFDDPKSKHWYWGTEEGQPGSIITYFERDPRKTRRVQMGTGQTHHFAFAVKDEADQLEYRERLLAAGIRVSPVLDRIYFKSIYSQDPDGHIVEIATANPGFAVDEPVATLGSTLMLPPWLEEHRAQIENAVKPVTLPTWPLVQS
jgi:glyoxalase family protein